MDHGHERPGLARDDAVASRLRLIRKEKYGEGGAPEIAAQLGLPLRAWLDYEGGEPMPGVVLLACLELTGADPLWVLSGVGSRYRTGAGEGDDPSPGD